MHVFLNYITYVSHVLSYCLLHFLVFHCLYVEDSCAFPCVQFNCCFEVMHDIRGVHPPHFSNPLSQGGVITLALFLITHRILQQDSSPWTSFAFLYVTQSPSTAWLCNLSGAPLSTYIDLIPRTRKPVFCRGIAGFSNF